MFKFIDGKWDGPPQPTSYRLDREIKTIQYGPTCQEYYIKK